MGDVEILATVNICTRNRANSLRRTLESITAASINVSDAWALHIIDNGSSDNTASIIDEFVGILPIRLISAPEPGLSNARNVAVAQSVGQYIIWTDDDVIVDPDWLKAYFDVFRQNLSHGIFGGKATPVFEGPTPKWFLASEPFLWAMLAVRDNPSWRTISPPELPWGLNYAIRTDLQRRLPYDPDLGVAPGRQRGSEETSVLQAALDAGETGMWIWGAAVHHIIPRSRQRLSYIVQYYRAAGFDVRSVKCTRPNLKLGRVPVCVYARVAIETLKVVVRIATGNRHWTRNLINACLAIGNADRYRTEPNW